MRRFLLFCAGILLGLAAVTILWIAPRLFTLEDGWHSTAITRMVGLGIIVEGALAALGAAWCLGRAVGPSARMVLPLCGMLFLVAGVGPCGQATKDSSTLEVMDSMPGDFGSELVDDFRRHKWTEWAFAALWLAVGGVLLATPLLLKPGVWPPGRQIRGLGCGIAVGGFVLSGLGGFVCFANALAMEGASKDLCFAGYLGILGGAMIAVVGSVIALAGR